ncbi:GGDEF domain-containing protein [Devosia naphthalenivorans]|uniref:GGDEF domain-containing protein n=1 Tax=Devosia naphthalenivorans TaxID=2082392 RepID=UPI000D37B4CB|nr:GGDEF domain-containing protein [Devosia naphthalenivorans]
MTGLVNRRLFDLELAQTVSQSFPGQSFGVLVMDIDAFKAINDNHGHVAGDIVLKHFAKLMRTTFRSGDCVSRWGGDEFAVIVRHPTSRGDVDTAAKRLREAVLERPVNVGAAEIPISVSVGIAYYPEDADSMTDLYSVADARMYEAKRRKKAPPAI